MSEEERFLRQAIELAHANIAGGGRPFGAVVVKDGAAVATGVNEVVGTNDPTAHAEMVAIRAASRALGSASLDGCTIYASGQPCPMCMAALRVAGVRDVAYAYSAEDGAAYGFSTAASFSAEQSMRIRHVPVRMDSRPDLYGDWQRSQGRQS